MHYENAAEAWSAAGSGLLRCPECPAAGSFVLVGCAALTNPGGELLVFRRGSGVAFPGGKLEKTDSDIYETTRRELLEETGVRFDQNRLRFVASAAILENNICYIVILLHATLGWSEAILTDPEGLGMKWMSADEISRIGFYTGNECLFTSLQESGYLR